MLLVHATAARYGHAGAARDDAKARRLAEVLTASPPFFSGASAPWPDPMFHTPGWVGNLIPGYSVMDKAIDPKIAEGLAAAYQARDALQLPPSTSALIADEIGAVAHGPFFRFPNVRLNQINWPLELDAYAAQVTGDASLLRDEYALQVGRFVAGSRAPWLGPGTTTNLSPGFRFHYLPHKPASHPINLDSAEYANMTLHFLAFYDEARRAGMPEPPPADLALLRGWVQRALFAYWTHSGLLNWDTGLGMKRWMKGKTWAYAQQGLLAIASAARFRRDPRYRSWAKYMFDAGLDLYGRIGPASNLYGVNARVRAISDDLMFAARMGANASRAIAAGLGRLPAEQPPPFYAYDADVGRLAVSTPAYSTAIVAVNRRAFPYGGIELARLLDARARPLTGIGGTPPAALGIVVRDRAGEPLLVSQQGFRRDQRRPPLVLTRAPRATSGPFRTLEAVGRRRSPTFAVRTRHRFTARAIDETWTVRRRRGHEQASVVLQLPTWGRATVPRAALRHGRTMPIGSSSLALDGVRGFRLGRYRVRLLRPLRGSVRAVPTAPERSNPDPGPTLELALIGGRHFRSVRVDARLLVDRARPARAGEPAP